MSEFQFDDVMESLTVAIARCRARPFQDSLSFLV